MLFLLFYLSLPGCIRNSNISIHHAFCTLNPWCHFTWSCRGHQILPLPEHRSSVRSNGELLKIGDSDNFFPIYSGTKCMEGNGFMLQIYWLLNQSILNWSFLLWFSFPFYLVKKKAIINMLMYFPCVYIFLYQKDSEACRLSKYSISAFLLVLVCGQGKGNNLLQSLVKFVEQQKER